MQGIITIVILYFLFSFIFKRIKRMAQTAKEAQDSEAMNPRPSAPPKPKQDFRFPPVTAKTKKSGRRDTAFHTEGAKNHTPISKSYTPITDNYTPITPSSDLESHFSDYEGSLDVTDSEGIGYEAEAQDPIAPAYQYPSGGAVQVLPEKFHRDTLLQAVVMSEILKRPRASR